MAVSDGRSVPGSSTRVERLNDEDAAILFADAVSRWGRPSVVALARPSEVIDLCRELEGLPLALELAARRTAVQSLPELVAALRGGSLAGVLDGPDSGGSGPTIRAAVSECFAGLQPAERRLAVELTGFQDWSTFDEIADGSPDPVGLDALTALVDHDIVAVEETRTETLFRMRRPHRESLQEELRTDTDAQERALAAEKMRHESLEAQSLRVAESLVGWSSGEAEQTRSYDVVRRRHTDLVTAAWMLLGRDEREAIRAGARISLALSLFAAENGDLAAEGGLLDRALSLQDRAQDPWTAILLHAYCLRRRFESVDPTTDADQLAADLQSAVSAATELCDVRVILECLAQSVGSARTIGHLDQARRHADQGVELAARNGMQDARVNFELLAAMIAHVQGRFADAAERANLAYILARRLDQRVLLAQAALMFHQLPAGTPLVPRHRPSVRDLAGMVGELPARRTTLGVTNGVAAECLRSGDLGAAAAAAAVSIRTSRAIGLPIGAGVGIMIIVVLAAASGQAAESARLHGAVADHYEVVRNGLSPGHQATYESAIDGVRATLGEQAFARECDRGASMTWMAAIEEALATADAIAARFPEVDAAQAKTVGVPMHPALTARQLEVLSLLAAGMSNREISELLFMAPKTTMHHTSNIYRRLGVHGRGQAVALARHLGIA